MEKSADKNANTPQKVSLKTLAAYLGLDPGTVSVVLNEVPGRSIPEKTRERIRSAAKELNYQPSLLARSLRMRKTMTVGVLVPVLGEGYHTEVLSGIGDQLLEDKYFYFITHHLHRRALIEQYQTMLIARGVEGLIAVDTAIEHAHSVPMIAVAGHKQVEGVTNIVLDHRRAAELALRHLYDFGHRKIAFMHGQPFSSDSDVRWSAVMEVARELGLTITPELTIYLDRDLTSPELGYPVIQQLLSHHKKFTALLSFNDIAAIGAIRALHDAGLKVPDDISVIGFDDIRAAAFMSPSLTTVRQPLYDMGQLAATVLLRRLRGEEQTTHEIAVDPQLVVRESTRPLRKTISRASRLGA
jgi:DNA-binding LacI/PurR family transcriptional regulator